MLLSEWSKSEAEYGRRVLNSGLEGARSGREAFLNGRPLTPFFRESFQKALKPAALQIINHLQDCRKDYRSLDRVYVPLDAMERHGVKLEDLGAQRASPALTNCIRDLAARTRDLLHEAAPFSMLIDDLRLALEVAVIHKLAVNLVGRLMRRDPLRERVHHNAAEAAGLAAAAVVAALPRRAARRPASAHSKVQDV